MTHQFTLNFTWRDGAAQPAGAVMEAQDRREHRGPAAPGTPGRASVGLVRSVPVRLAQTPTTYWVSAEPHRDRLINRT